MDFRIAAYGGMKRMYLNIVIFEFIMVSHSIKKAEDLDPAKDTHNDIRDVRCLHVAGSFPVLLWQ